MNHELARATICRRASPAKAAPFPRSDFAIDSQLFGGWERRFTTFGRGNSQFGPLDSQLDSQLFGRPTAKRKRKWQSGSRDRHSHSCGCSQVHLPLTITTSLAHYYHPSHSATVYPDLRSFTHLVCSAYSTKITVTSNIQFSERYLKYLTKKFLTKGSLRGLDFW